MTDQSAAPLNTFEDFWREAPCGQMILDPTLTVVNANEAAAQLMGRENSGVIGESLSRWFAPESFDELVAAADACFRSRDPVALAVTVRRSTIRVDRLRARLRTDSQGRMLYLVLSPIENHDVEAALLNRELKEARLAASIVAASNDAIFSVDSEGAVLSWNRGAESLYGYTAAEIVGKNLSELVPEGRRAESRQRMRAVLAGGNVYFETERRAKDESLKPVSISGGPLHDRHGRVVGVAAVHRDISAQVRHEAQLRFVMRELAHRTKNLLAIIQSIERQTARTVSTSEEFHDRFSARLQALAASHDLLVEGNWGGALIGDLVERHLSAFSDQIGDRITTRGPPLRLSPAVAQTLGLALHELATNATKYGALAAPSGRVAVQWGIAAGADGRPLFQMAWRESGGAPVSPPSRRGFGLLAIERLAPQALNGRAELEFSPEGLQWILSADPSSVEDGV